MLNIFRQFLLFDSVLVNGRHEVGERSTHSELRLEDATGEDQRFLEDNIRLAFSEEFLCSRT